MDQPALLIMAAGMGSRFGGPKQITPVDDRGHILIDFSLYDAWKAGFRKVVFVIKEEMEADFRARIGDAIEPFFEVCYVHQKLQTLPEGFSVPEGRVKPWGTGHAVACAAPVIHGSFAVINADDYYGRSALSAIYQFLAADGAPNAHAMVGYQLRNTVTEFGHVARGVCEIRDGYLTGVTERTHIEKRGDDAAYTEDGEHFIPLAGDTVVSMNMWGFRPMIMDQLWERFPRFLEKTLRENPLKGEFFLPSVANAQIQEGLGTVRVLETNEQWYGVTYREDLESVQAAIGELKRQGFYPERLWQVSEQ